MKKAFSIIILLLSFYHLRAQSDTTTVNEEANLPTFTLTETDLDNEQESQDVSGLLQASRDIFVSTAGYTFGPARYRMRGYDSQNLAVMMDGVLLNDPETGRAYWSSWGGLNDATRNKVIQNGIVASDYGFGGLAGLTQIITRPSTYRKQQKVSYSLSNRSYTNRLMVTYSTGEMTNGWSIVASASRRWAQEGYVKGTFYDAWAYFFGVENGLTKGKAWRLRYLVLLPNVVKEVFQRKKPTT